MTANDRVVAGGTQGRAAALVRNHRNPHGRRARSSARSYRSVSRRHIDHIGGPARNVISSRTVKPCRW